MKQVNQNLINDLMAFSAKVELTKTKTIAEVHYDKLMKIQFDNALKIGLLSRYTLN